MATPVARHPPPVPQGAQGLRAIGYSALQNRRYAEAFWQLQQATILGDAYAPMYIGQMFEYGLGVARDPGQASYWYGIAVNRGNAAALAAFRRLRENPY
jgi:TPR repeat protein